MLCRTEFTLVTLCPGTFANVFAAFLGGICTRQEKLGMNESIVENDGQSDTLESYTHSYSFRGACLV